MARLQNIGGDVFAVGGQVVEANPSGFEQVHTIRRALENRLVRPAVPHLQLFGDLLDLGLAHLFEQVEPAHEAELVGHSNQGTCGRSRCWLHVSYRLHCAQPANRDAHHGRRLGEVGCSKHHNARLGQGGHCKMSQESGTRTVLNWALPGLIGGLVFAMWAMVFVLFTTTLWAPPQGIAQSIGIGSAGHDFQLAPLLIGLVGHMMNSLVLGVIFVAIARAIRLQGIAAVVEGMVYGVIVYVAMYLAVLRAVLSATSASFSSP